MPVDRRRAPSIAVTSPGCLWASLHLYFPDCVVCRAEGCRARGTATPFLGDPGHRTGPAKGGLGTSPGPGDILHRDSSSPGLPPPTCRPPRERGRAQTPASHATQRPLDGLPRSSASRGHGPMSARLSARPARRLGGSGARAVAELAADRSARGAAARCVPCPAHPHPARPAASMGAAAVRWHLCVLLALGARGRMVGGSGLPGKREDPGD